MTDWFKNNSWAALTAAVAIAFFVGLCTHFEQLSIGLLMAAIALLVAVAVFEVIWQAAAKGLGSADEKQRPERGPKSRQRGQ